MNFLEAIKLLKARKCVRRHKWRNKDYIYYNPCSFVARRYYSRLDGSFPYNIVDLPRADLCADDWEEMIKKED